MFHVAGSLRQKGIVEIQGHRGARGLLAENTLPSFAYALSIGVCILEIDIQMTRDGVLVVTHDFRLSSSLARDDKGSWVDDGPEVIDLTYDELRRYDVGGLRSGTDYAARYPDQAFLNGIVIPSLDEVMALCRTKPPHEAALNIEIKSDPTRDVHRQRRGQVIDTLIASLKQQGFEDRVIVQSFDWALIDDLKDKAPDIERAYLTVEESEVEGDELRGHATVFRGSPWLGRSDFDANGGSVAAMLAKEQASFWSAFYRDLTAEKVAEAHRLGLGVNAWTVNDFVDIEHMIDIGVDGIISDYPARVQRVLMDRGLRWK
nr:glycerophosphodiester phosphodiesterase family protein [uncultured Cohaesibacter sp.]